MADEMSDEYFASWTEEEWAEVLDDPLVMSVLRLSGLTADVKHQIKKLQARG